MFGLVAGAVRRNMAVDFVHPQLINIVHLGMALLFLATECGFLVISKSLRYDNLHTIIMGLTIPFFIFVFSFDSICSRFLFSNPLLRFMGKLSFPLYLLHMPVLYWVKKFYPGDIADPAVVVATFLLILAFASVYFYTVEKYCNDAVKSFGKKHLDVISSVFVRIGIKAKCAPAALQAP
jgi:peptidoglycan/LPS O-acetylase OafA/YrhL